jgi:F0F1-type ATP synthase assembly protein I
MMDWLQENWKIAVAVLAGAVLVFVVGIRTDSLAAAMVVGLIVGILIGGLISTMSRQKDRGRRR